MLEVRGREGWVRFRVSLVTTAADLQDLATFDGWNGTDTVVECYQHADQERLREALAARERGRTGS